jgi:hypothetical protein
VSVYVGVGGVPDEVVKLSTAPKFVPPAVVATRRNWYVVPDARPERDAETGTALVPEPGADEQGTFAPDGLPTP